MVNNKLNILDEGQIKMLPEVIEMKKPSYVYQFEDEICSMNLCFSKKQNAGEVMQNKLRTMSSINCQNEIKYYETCCQEWNDKFENNEFLKEYLFETSCSSNVEYKKIAKYYNIIPFTPSVMINISPDWGCGEKRSNK